jgi:hypothetical protein
MRAATLLLLSAAGLGAENLVRTDFAAPFQPVSGNPRASGVLPAGWRDNTSWAQTWVEYSRQTENGSPFLRVNVTRIDDGWAQLVGAMPRWTSSAYMRLRMKVRASEGIACGLGIRQNASPYTYLWQTTRFPDAAWQDLTLYARIDPASFDIGFYLTVNAPGVFDMAAFILDRLTESELVAELAATAGDYPKNLLRNTRFPLGLPGGWSLDRDSSDGDVVTMEPDGAALHVVSPLAAILYSEPFPVPRPLVPYTASVAVRGSGTFRLAVVSNGRTVAQTSVTPTGEWQRVRATFTPVLLASATNLRMDVTGEVWIDSAQVELGGAATAYASGGDCEVALAVDGAAPARVQFDDEPARMAWAVTGACATLRARVVNIYGESAALAPVALADAARGVLRYDVFPQRPYGPFRVEVWAEDVQGRRASPYNELVVYRLRRPRYWMIDAPDSPFGVHTTSTTRHILMAKAVGANWTRLHDAGLEYIGWYHLERQPGAWTFRDDDLNRYRTYGMKILGLLSTAPEWASYFQKPHNGYYDRFFQPRNLDDYARYVRTVASRYLGIIDTWDVWNEPWNVGWWAVSYDEQRQVYVTSAHPQADFARLQKTAYDAAKSVDPSLVVTAANATTGSTGANWLAGIVSAGGLGTCDIINYHDYTSGAVGWPGDSVETGWKTGLAPAMLDGKPFRPVWMTEGSSVQGAGMLGPGFFHYTVPFDVTENYQHTSDRLARFLVSNLAQGHAKIFLYSMHSHAGFSTVPSPWRVLVGEDGYLHPNAAAHSALAWLLEDARFAKVVRLRDGLFAYLFARGAGAVAVLSPANGNTNYTLPAPGLDLYGNPLPKGAPLGASLVYLTSEAGVDELEALLR